MTPEPNHKNSQDEQKTDNSAKESKIPAKGKTSGVGKNGKKDDDDDEGEDEQKGGDEATNAQVDQDAKDGADDD